jgi:hypothetical protein
MTEEERYVVDTFKKAFERDSSKRICLYGTGRFTELLLNEVKEYNILGVTDFNERKNVGGGYKLLSREFVEDKIDILVLIANPANIHLVFKKVRELPEKINIYTIDGRDVRKEEKFKEQAVINETISRLRRYVVSSEDEKAIVRFQKKVLGDGLVRIQDVYSLINIFVAPWLLSYFAWFLRKIKEIKADIVLLPSRDGYLFYKLYELLPNHNSLPQIMYFYLSRRCVSVASIKNILDIKIIANQVYSGEKRNFLKERFGVDISLEESELLLSREELALRYKDCILENAKEEREYFDIYLRQKGIENSKSILTFDFIGRGTNQYCLEKIIGRPLECLYYFKIEDEGCIEKNRTKGVISYSGMGSFYMKKLFTQRNQVLFEAIVSAPHGMVERFKEDGIPVFQKSDKIDKSYFSEVQRACTDYYFEMYSDQDSPKELNLMLVDRMAEIMEYSCITIDEEVKKNFTVDDPYQNMCTNPFFDGYLK